MKKSKKPRFWMLLFWLVMISGTLWLLFAPTHPKRVSKPVQVAVHAPPPEPEVKPEPPREPEPAPQPAIGDERAQVTPPPVAPVIVPPPPVAGGHNALIAIVIDDVGLDLKDSKRAVALPAYVTLSYIPYSLRLKEQTKEARDQGHELLLHMPMEPMGRDDPGPGALLTSLSTNEIHQRFEKALGSFVGFDGVNNHMGSKFTAYHDGMEIVIDELKQRHLFFLDSRTSNKTVGEAIAREQGVPTIARDVFLDDDISTKGVEAQLAQTERIARRKGYAIAIGHPHAITLQALETWLPEAEKRGIIFVPLRQLVLGGEKQP